MSSSDLLQIARDACRAGVQAGAQYVEVAAQEGRQVRVRMERSSIDSAELNHGAGASIRAYVRGGLGSVTVDGLDPSSVIAAASQAAEMARHAAEDKDFRSLPEPEPAPEVPGLYDPQIAEMGVADMAAILVDCMNSATELAPDCHCTGAASAGSGRSALVNNLGVEREGQSSSISAWIEPIIRRGDDVGAFYDFDSARLLTDFDHRKVGRAAAEIALKLLGAEKVESGVMPVVLGPLAASDLIDSLAAAANAEGHQRGRSWLCGKLGQEIASPILTIRDDATIPAGLGSRAYDSEGVASRPLTIFENGILMHLLHNSYTAGKAGTRSTGHAMGQGIGPTNAIPELGERSSAEIIGDVERGIYINMGSVSPNAVTGEISAMVDFGFLIENGQLSRPVSSTMIGGNGLEMLKSIDAISSDARLEPGSVMPTIRIQNLRVAGGR